MKTDKVIGKVYTTNNLEQFKMMQSNRELRGRVKTVKASIEKHGWINSPIVCNERMEVVDGQARLQACKELGCGLSYTVVHGLDVHDCRVLNSVGNVWTYQDYIYSYADAGIQDYRYIQQIVTKMTNEWGSFSVDILQQMLGKSRKEDIKDGTAKMSMEQYNEACKHISFVAPFIPVLKGIGIYGERLYGALFFASRKMPEYARERLLDAFKARAKYVLTAKPGRMVDAIKAIDEIYNYNRKKDYRFILLRAYEDNGGVYAD